MIKELCDLSKLLPLAPPGWEYKKIDYTIIIDSLGCFVDLVNNTDQTTKSVLTFKVPQASKRSGSAAYSTANLLWDNNKYILNIEKNKKTPGFSNISNNNYTNSFIKNTVNFNQTLNNKDIQSVLLFLNNQLEIDKLKTHQTYQNDLLNSKIDVNLTFKIDIDQDIICVKLFNNINDYINNISFTPNSNYICSIYGSNTKSESQRLIPDIRGIKGGQPTGAIISFNESAFESYGFVQGENTNISVTAAEDFTKSLNYLLNSDSNKSVVGENTIVYWCKNNLSSNMDGVIDYSLCYHSNEDKENIKEDVSIVKGTISSVFKEKYIISNDDLNDEYHILCLNPNAKRVSIRFFIKDKVVNIYTNIKNHFENLQIDVGKYSNNIQYNLYSLINVCFKQDSKNINVVKNLISEFSIAILTGKQYPTNLQPLIINRIKQESNKKENHDRFIKQVSLLKAILNRKNIGEIKMSLDTNNTDESYLYGRLFAIYEKVQRASSKTEINSSIKDTYFKLYIQSPKRVLSKLEQLNISHKKKLDRDKKGLSVHFDKIKKEITDKLSCINSNLDYSLDQQSKLILGYYHQLTF